VPVRRGVGRSHRDEGDGQCCGVRCASDGRWTAQAIPFAWRFEKRIENGYRRGILEERIDGWVLAELAGDAARLDGLAIDDFTPVGPLGFVLDRVAWLGRYAAGGLVTTSLSFTEWQVRILGEVAVVIGVPDQVGSYAGRPDDGRHRATQVWVDALDSPRLAGMQFSPIVTAPRQ
jgi:hypothetical protein